MEYSRSLLDQPHWGLPRRLSWDFYDADDDDDDSGGDGGDDDGDGDGDDYDVGPSSLRFASSFILRHFLLMIMIKVDCDENLSLFDNDKNTHLDTV